MYHLLWQNNTQSVMDRGTDGWTDKQMDRQAVDREVV